MNLQSLTMLERSMIFFFTDIIVAYLNEYRYPDYVFYGDSDVAKSAQLNTRYGTQSLKGVLLDIHFLSLTDYLVCTFSSQVTIFSFVICLIENFNLDLSCCL
jgi:hypothetical protein